MSQYHWKKNQAMVQSIQSINGPNIYKSYCNSPFGTLMNSPKKYENRLCQNDQVRPKWNLQEEESIKQLNSLIKTNQHSVNLEELKQIYHLKNDYHDHFNDYLAKKKQVQNPHLLCIKKRRNLRKSQHLKNISKYLKLLITYNKNLSVKELSYLLYQMIGQTSLGLEIVYQKNPVISGETKRKLAIKYFDEQNAEEDVQNLIKNVRRRLYDALNVLISSNIIEKKSNRLLQVSNKQKILTEKSMQNLLYTKLNEEKVYLKNSEQNLYDQIKQAQYKVQKKKAILEAIKIRYSMMKKLIQKNKRYQSTQCLPVFQLPLVIVKTQPFMLVQLEEGSLKIKYSKQIKIFSDMEIVDYTFKTKQEKQEIESQATRSF